MKILHVVNISFVIPYFLGNQLKWFEKKGYKEFIVCSPSEELKRFSNQYGFEYREVEVLRKISIWKDLKSVYAIIRYIRQTKVDVVTGHTPKGGLLAMIAAYITRVPIRIYFRHGLVYETSTGLKRTLLIYIDRLVSCLATKIVCVSPSVAIQSLKDGLNSPRKQIVLAHGTCNGIDVNRFNKDNIDHKKIDQLKTQLEILEGDFVIGFTGRLVRDKGIVELVRAFKDFRLEYNNAKLLLVGMYETRDALPKDVVSAIEKDNSIIHVGYVENTEIEYYYALMDVFIFPSYREGFGTSTIEASSMSIPVAVPKITGCIDSIIENETGLFITHDRNNIKSVIEKLYRDELLRKELGKNGRKFVIENFRQELVWEEIEKLYKLQ